MHDPLLNPPPRHFMQRFNNCLQLLSCICNVAAMFMDEFRQLARIIDLIADLVYMSTVGCMTVSTRHSFSIKYDVFQGKLVEGEVT